MKNGFAEVRNPDCSVRLGPNVTIGKNVVLGPSCKTVEIGFGSRLGRDLYLDVEELRIGDYCTIHHGSLLHGIKTSLGHNCWIGHYSIIDSLGGDTRLGNNVGVGAHSQLWSHMKFGDVLAGCRWHSSGSLVLGDDVWLVGHSIVGPITAAPASMLMTGSVAVRDMVENHVYAGSPARDMTEKFGTQFEWSSLRERGDAFQRLKEEFESATGVDTAPFRAVEKFSDAPDVTEFNLAERSYKPRYTSDEYRFMRFLLYDKAKFVPVSAG